MELTLPRSNLRRGMTENRDAGQRCAAWYRSTKEVGTLEKIRLLLVDDHTLVRQGIRSLLETQDDIEVVAEASGGHEAIAKAVELRPDVILMDLAMPDLNGMEATRQIQPRKTPCTRALQRETTVTTPTRTPCST